MGRAAELARMTPQGRLAASARERAQAPRRPKPWLLPLLAFLILWWWAPLPGLRLLGITATMIAIAGALVAWRIQKGVTR